MIEGEVSACAAINDYPMMGDVGGVGFFLEIGCDNKRDVFNLLHTFPQLRLLRTRPSRTSSSMPQYEPNTPWVSVPYRVALEGGQ